ncbi:hypothetical protein PVAP13_2NG121106 [Panicum virgatum]|uniref:Uncharacterized protein n=1 Tax=Panicum virgatum TaxID=38727 RepID=A0A8T0VEJ0_PANVG|nr:hypothetical protein PVAP13_2NG121106 [Panicum virgatum]
MHSTRRLMQRLMLRGMTPVSMFTPRSSCWRRLREPMLGGISPCRPLKLRLSDRRKVRLPMAGEMVPAKPCALRSRATTRHRYLRLQVTPSQLQWLLLWFQEASTPGWPEILALKATRALSSS